MELAVRGRSLSYNDLKKKRILRHERSKQKNHPSEQHSS